MIRLPSEAVTLLTAAAEDENGIIIWRKHLGGEIIQTNGQNFTEGANARSLATWRDAIQRLHAACFVDLLESGNLYQVTKSGYDYLDQLAKLL